MKAKVKHYKAVKVPRGWALVEVGDCRVYPTAEALYEAVKKRGEREVLKGVDTFALIEWEAETIPVTETGDA